MSPEQINLFLDSIRKAGLLSDAEVESLSDELDSDSATSEQELADQLVTRQMLTAYQAERLLAGQGDECVLAGRYHLLEPIGTGGMGSVFKARDTHDKRYAAVKIMAVHLLQNPDAVARFKREAKALAHLDLPNVVKAYDSGKDRGRHFLVMEWVPGVSLKQLLADRGKVPPTVAADYIYQAAVGMQGAHDRGLIHRDLKPANLLLTPDGQVKILDLGLARFMQDQVGDGTITRDFVGLGTPDYMPPEQCQDARRVDGRADIYSLGCTLYHLIAGIVPFPGSSLSEKADAHENKEPPPLEERAPDIPAGLAVVVERLMAKRPVDRYQTMREAAAALALYVAGSSPSLPTVKKTASWYDSTTLRRRRRNSLLLKVGAGVVAGIVIVFGLLAAAGFFRECRFGHNRRDLTGGEVVNIIPLAQGDHKLDREDFLSTNPVDKDFLRPKKHSPLANQGAGSEDKFLPAYVGAVPPEDVTPWDWNVTWQARNKEAPSP